MTGLVLLGFLGFLSGFLFLQPQAHIPYFPISLATPVRALTRLVLGPPPTLRGKPVVTVCPGHPKNTQCLPVPVWGMLTVYLQVLSTVVFLCLSFLLSCSFFALSYAFMDNAL